MKPSSKPHLRLVRRLWSRITERWTADVPGDLSCCEFNCRQFVCEKGEWMTCEKRLDYERRARANQGESR